MKEKLYRFMMGRYGSDQFNRFLMLLGVSEETAAADACKMEHDLSDESFEKMKEQVLKSGGQ